MIILTNTTDSIDVVLLQNAAANQMQCYAAFRDTTSSAITPSSRVVTTNNTTAVSIVQPPAGSTQRVVDFISVQNVDTLQNDVIIRFNDNGTTYTLFQTRLNVGDKIEYHDGKGFKVINSAGSRVTNLSNSNSISNLATGTIVLTEDVDVTVTGSTNVINIDIPRLQFPVIYDRVYAFKFNVFYDVNATTTGVRINTNIGNLQTNSGCMMGIVGTTGTGYIVNDLNTAAYIGNATSATTPATTENCARVEGIMRANFNGLIGLNAGHEVAAGATMVIKKGSMVHYQQLT